MLGAQQAIEDLFHHDGVKLDKLWQGLDHFLLQGQDRGGQIRCTPCPLQISLPTARPGAVRGKFWPHLAAQCLPLLPLFGPSRFSFPSSLGLTQPQPYHPQASPWAGSMAPPTRGDGGSPEVPHPGRHKTGAGEVHAQGEVSPALLLWLHLVLRTIVCTGWGERGGEGRRAAVVDHWDIHSQEEEAEAQRGAGLAKLRLTQTRPRLCSQGAREPPSSPPCQACPRGWGHPGVQLRTFSSPLSTGMRKRTSGSRLW